MITKCNLLDNSAFIEIENEAKMRITLCSFGASLYNLEVKDNNGVYVPLVLTYQSPSEFKNTTRYFGKSIGRVAGRIPYAKFTLNEKEYQLDINNKRHTLYGGYKGFSHQEFSYEISDKEGETIVTFRYFSPDGDCNFPGNLHISIVYRIAKYKKEFTIEFHGISDADTLLNLTNHTYFNLNGDLSKDVLNHVLTIKASHYTKVDDEIIVESIEPVNFVMDFRNGKRVGEHIDDPSIR